jgi:hypothetical protein
MVDSVTLTRVEHAQIVESVRSVGVARMGLLWLPLVHFLGSVLSGVFYCFLHEPPLNQ